MNVCYIVCPAGIWIFLINHSAPFLACFSLPPYTRFQKCYGETIFSCYFKSVSIPSLEAFRINKDSGLITTRRRLQSYERFNLTVLATDKGRPPLWGTTMLQVDVIDINDNRPLFVRPPNGTILHIKEVSLL